MPVELLDMGAFGVSPMAFVAVFALNLTVSSIAILVSIIQF
jgi:hypothetical protein